MSLKSMTGHGRGEASSGGMKVEVELSSINRKQFDVRIGLPRTLIALESRVYELLHKMVSRGCVTGTVGISLSGDVRNRGISVDRNMARAYVQALRKAAEDLGLKDDLTARTLVSLRDVVQYEDGVEDTGKVWRLLKTALKEAISRLIEMRKTEGETLEKDLVDRFGRLIRRLDSIKKLAPGVSEKYCKVLETRVRKAGVCVKAGSQELLREVVLFADRSDISEEIVRLDSHIGQVSDFMHSKRPAGRSLDFLCQEMFREINTIGAKANDAAISKHVVRFKADLESIREQVQNVE